MPTPSSNASDPGSRIAKRQGPRAASNLSSTQLERKRANDRECQRVIRARNKERIARLEHELHQLRNRDLDREMRHLMWCNRALETELRHLRALVGLCSDPAVYHPPGMLDARFPDDLVPKPANYASTCLEVPCQFVGSPSPDCSSVSSVWMAPASYAPAGHVTDDTLGNSFPVAAADLDGFGRSSSNVNPSEDGGTIMAINRPVLERQWIDVSAKETSSFPSFV
ncbi:bZIP transcription factor [Metarhizium rileyi]|uniref:BZIP transcription factor n=1 Tax=Metarhizium rileyi (strain RCEF 4871) TaxID=1649241 RepID=A0A162LWS6_METRR|nr:bZIP transcription factor [Metarhizium rileyi RCEF 4871]